MENNPYPYGCRNTRPRRRPDHRGYSVGPRIRRTPAGTAGGGGRAPRSVVYSQLAPPVVPSYIDDDVSLITHRGAYPLVYYMYRYV